MQVTYSTGRLGRPPLDRQRLLDAIENLPLSGRDQVIVRPSEVAGSLGWSRSTLWRAMRELADVGLIRPFPGGHGPPTVLLSRRRTIT